MGFGLANWQICLVIAFQVFAQENLGSWSSKAPMGTKCNESSGTYLDGKMFVGGGLTSEGGIKAFHAYDPGKDEWEKMPDLPIGMHHLHMTALAGKLYVLGGCAHKRNPTDPYGVPWLGSDYTFEFNPSTQKWRELKPLPHPTGMGGAVAFGNKLYVIGGVDDKGVTLNLVQEYDPVTDNWVAKSPMPTPREHLGIAVLDSLIYVAAGRPTGLGEQSLTNFEAYSPNSDKWYVLEKVPTKRSGLALAAAKGRLYALGGEWPGVQKTNEEYDPATKKWRTAKDMPNARHGFPAVTLGDQIFLVGYSAKTDVFSPPDLPARTIIETPNAARHRPSQYLRPFFNALGVQQSDFSATPSYNQPR